MKYIFNTARYRTVADAMHDLDDDCVLPGDLAKLITKMKCVAVRDIGSRKNMYV